MLGLKRWVVSSAQMLVNPEKVIKIKDKEIFYLLSYYSEDERYNCYCLNLLSYYSEHKEIFYLL